ncbi:MAG: NACHT domain-containing protein [Nostoc sp. TH1S01]|nr:NACHT domain-containing protein [Nostoc sp. TH1S01]
MSRSLKVRPECWENVKLALKRNGYPSQKCLSQDIGLALATISKFLNGKPVDYQIFLEICLKLGLDWQAIAELGNTELPKPASIKSITNISHQSCDWGEAIDVSVFYGRTTELNHLQQSLVNQHSRIVAILGIGGVGKTALAIRLAQQVQTEFEYVIWRSLRNAPPLEQLLRELVSFISQQQETKAEITHLIHYLRTSHCLLILDNWESILQAGDYVGQYCPGYEGYGELLKVIGQVSHQSCLLLTSREKPAEIAEMEGLEQAVNSITLKGSSEVAQALIQARKLSGTEMQKQQLCDRYSNNPLALKIVATSICDLFDGKIDEFLEQDTVVFNGIRRLLDKQFQRLSPLEKTIMYWLANNQVWTSISDLHTNIVPAVSKANLLDALESLNRRYLIEKQGSQYAQQPVVIEYIFEQLIKQVSSDMQDRENILLESDSPFKNQSLQKTKTKHYAADSHRKLILEAIA